MPDPAYPPAETDLHALKTVTYQQQNIINALSQSSDPKSKETLEVMKPQYEQSLSLYEKALKKLKPKSP